MHEKKAIRLIVAVFLLTLILIPLTALTGRGRRHMFKGEEATKDIIFEEEHIFITPDAAIQKKGSTVEILRGGTYVVKGELSDGQIVVDTGSEEEVTLKLNGVSLACSFGSPIYVKQAKKLTLKLKDGDENLIVDKRKAEEDKDLEKACIYARSDLKVKGEGSLTVKGGNWHGLFSSKDLKVKSGTIRVEAEGHGLHGKKSVLIEDGSLDIKAGTNGIHSRGTLDITGGKVHIDAGRYGMYAFTHLIVKEGAKVTVKNALSEAGCHGKMEYSLWQ